MKSSSFSFMMLGIAFIITSSVQAQKFELTSIPGFNPNLGRPTSSFWLNTKYGRAALFNEVVHEMDLVSNNKIAAFHIEAGYQGRIKPSASDDGLLNNKFRRLLSYGIGFGYSKYGNQLFAASMEQSYEASDLPGVSPRELLQWNVKYNGFVEEVTINSIHVPLFLELGTTNIDNLGLFLRFGLNLSIPLTFINSFDGEGSYSASGYYENYQVEIEGVNELGFYNDMQLHNKDDKYNINNLQLAGAVSGGLSYPIPGLFGWIVNFGGQYVFGLSDAIKPEIRQNIHPADDMKLMFNNNSPTRVRWFGLQVGVQYVLGIY